MMGEKRNTAITRGKDEESSKDAGQGELYSPANAVKVTNDNNKEEKHETSKDEDVGQGELYSPAHAIKVSSGGSKGSRGIETTSSSSAGGGGVVEASKEVAMDVKKHLGDITDKILDKISPNDHEEDGGVSKDVKNEHKQGHQKQASRL